MSIFSTIGRVLFGGKKKTTSSTATMSGTQNVQPYAPAIPFLNDYLNNTANIYANTPQISDLEQSGYDYLENMVNSGQGNVDAAIAENNKTLGGEYLDVANNPYLQAIASRMGGEAGAGANMTFGGRGRTGSGLHQQSFGRGVGEAVANVFAPAYESERGRMSSAVGMAPSLEAGRYLGPQALISAGQNVSARPFDVNQQYGGILSQIAGLGHQGQTTGQQQQQNYKNTGGIISTIGNSFINKLFG